VGEPLRVRWCAQLIGVSGGIDGDIDGARTVPQSEWQAHRGNLSALCAAGLLGVGRPARAGLETRISSSRMTSGEGRDVRVRLYVLVAALVLVGLGWCVAVPIARSSPEILHPQIGRLVCVSSVCYPVAQACPDRAAPTGSRWSAPLADRPGPGRRGLMASGASPVSERRPVGYPERPARLEVAKGSSLQARRRGILFLSDGAAAACPARATVVLASSTSALSVGIRQGWPKAGNAWGLVRQSMYLLRDDLDGVFNGLVFQRERARSHVDAQAVGADAQVERHASAPRHGDLVSVVDRDEWRCVLPDAAGSGARQLAGDRQPPVPRVHGGVQHPIRMAQAVGRG
jgi:hypothetical protein